MAREVNKYHIMTIWMTYISFMLPPILWLTGCQYMKIWSGSETIKLLFSPQMLIFMLVFFGLVTLYVRSSINKLSDYQNNKNEQNTRRVQELMAFYPKMIFLLVGLYSIMGPTVVVYGRSFISNTEWLFAELMGIPLIILFAVPFITEIMYAVDRFGEDIPFCDDCGTWKLFARTSVSSFSTLFGALVLVVVSIFSRLNYMIANGTTITLSHLLGSLVGPIFMVVVVSFVSTILMGRRNANALKAIVNVIRGKLKNDKSVASEVEVTSRDEVGEVALLFNKFTGNSRIVIEKTQKNSGEIISLSNEMHNFSNEQVQKASDISTKTEEMRNSIGVVTQSVAKISENSVEITDSIKAITASAEGITRGLSKINSECLKETEIANDADLKARNTQEAIIKLKTASDEIENVLDIIKDIADKTNLLALNATIEAASAGDAGKGFAVVANEVKDLATQSAKATGEIADKINQVQSLTDVSVNGIADIAKVIEAVKGISEEILTHTEQQLASATEIRTSTQNAQVLSAQNSDKVDETTKEISGILSDVNVINDNMEDMTRGIEMLKDKSEIISELSEKQKDIVSSLTI